MNMENEIETKKYEFSYWIKPDITDNNLGDVQNEIKGFIEKLSGKIIKEKNIVRENLAYPIKHHKHGFLKVILMEFAPAKMDEFLKYLKLNINVIRYTIGATNDIDIPEIKEFKKIVIEPQKTKPVIFEKVKEGEGAEEKKTTDISPETPAVRQAPEPEKEKITLEDVDKKLEEILGRAI